MAELTYLPMSASCPFAQKALTAASPAAVVHALMGIPEAHISEQQAQAMRMLGSMQGILASTADDLMCCADLTELQCAQVSSRQACPVLPAKHGAAVPMIAQTACAGLQR